MNLDTGYGDIYDEALRELASHLSSWTWYRGVSSDISSRSNDIALLGAERCNFGPRMPLVPMYKGHGRIFLESIMQTWALLNTPNNRARNFLGFVRYSSEVRSAVSSYGAHITNLMQDVYNGYDQVYMPILPSINPSGGDTGHNSIKVYKIGDTIRHVMHYGATWASAAPVEVFKDSISGTNMFDVVDFSDDLVRNFSDIPLMAVEYLLDGHRGFWVPGPVLDVELNPTMWRATQAPGWDLTGDDIAACLFSWYVNKRISEV